MYNYYYYSIFLIGILLLIVLVGCIALVAYRSYFIKRQELFRQFNFVFEKKLRF
jgi:hypothetical protein